ncbi:MAG: hypothetical protein NW241_18915 [Bacteroidia bacterium]|nr:hypothetical protein [Bacteroidia bacterium]
MSSVAQPVSSPRSGTESSSSDSGFRFDLKYVFYAMLAVNLLIAVPLAMNLNLRSDEGYAMDTTSKDVAYAVHQAIHFELQAPFYFGVMSVWRKLYDSVFFARLFSIIMIVSAAFLLREVAKRYLPQVHYAWLTALYLLNPITIYAEVDVRCYALVHLLSVLLLITLYDGFISEQPRRASQLAYALLALTALYTHYYTGFLLAGGGAILLFHRKWKPLLQYFGWMLIPAAGLAYLSQFMGGQYSQKVLQADSNGLLDAPVYVFDLLDTFLIGTERFEIGSTALRWGVRLLIFAALAAPLLLGWRKLGSLLRQPGSLLPVGLAGMVFCYTVIFMIWGEEFLIFKFLSPMLVPALGTLLLLVHTLGKPRLMAYYVSVLALCYGIGLVNTYTPFMKTDDYIGVGDYLEEQESAGQPVFIFENVHHMLLQHHYQGVNELVALPFPINFDEPWGHERWVLTSEEQVAGVFARYPDLQSCWLVTHDQQVVKKVNLNHRYLESYISDHFDVVSTRKFPAQLTVRQLKAKPHLSTVQPVD